MKLSLTSWSFPKCTLAEVSGLSKVLGIHAIDLGYFYRSALDKSMIIEQPEAMADQILQLEIKVPCLYHLFGNDITDKNLSNAAFSRQNQKDLEQVVLFCKRASINNVFVLPGVVNPTQSLAEAMRVSVDNLNMMRDICDRHGVTLCVEPHVHSYLESPALTLELIDRVPGLKLMLDYAHFVCLGYTQETIDPLLPFAVQMHLRQARPGVLQTGLNYGTINFLAIFAQLRDQSFDGYLSIEYVHQDYMNTLYHDVISETVSMRDLAKVWMDDGLQY